MSQSLIENEILRICDECPYVSHCNEDPAKCNRAIDLYDNDEVERILRAAELEGKETNKLRIDIEISEEILKNKKIEGILRKLCKETVERALVIIREIEQLNL